MKRTAFTNCIIYTGYEVHRNKAVIVSNGLVDGIVENTGIPDDCERTDLHGFNLAPSFIDMQIYGGNGRLFSHELSRESIQSTYEYCLQGGAAHFMITMATNSIEKFLRGIEVARDYVNSGGQGLLGLHLEGPYINPAKKGAHIAEHIKTPLLEEVQTLIEKGRGIFKMMTLAPEQCSAEVLELLINNNIILSAGHSNATYAQGMDAFNHGIPAATHLFNAMSAFQSREPGMVGAIYDHPKVVSSVVCDGVHVDFAAIRISKKILLERLFYITDAVTEVLVGDYSHVFRGDRYTLPDGTLSGSSLSMMKCVLNGVSKVGISLEESLRMASMYPAKLLNDSELSGTIQQGKKASFVVFDNELNVVQTITTL